MSEPETGETELCPACLKPADQKGKLDNGDRVFLHGSNYCIDSVNADTDRSEVDHAE